MWGGEEEGGSTLVKEEEEVEEEEEDEQGAGPAWPACGLIDLVPSPTAD